MNLQTFEGDLLLYDTPDGGDIRVEEGLVASDRAFSTAVYISLFGGNKDDSGRVRNRRTWWGNTLRGVSESRRLASRFQAIVFGMPMTAKNILDAEEAARLDLSWITSEKIADKITADGRAEARNRFSLEIKISAAGETVYDNAFSVFWRSAGAV